MAWPDWWDWELELSPHLDRRMTDRGFNEVDLRSMLETAYDFQANHEPGRWAVLTRHDSRSWRVIVEPDEAERLLVVVTAYAVHRRSSR